MSWEYYDDPRPDVQALVDPRGLRCLDVGCGGGALAGALKAAGAEHVVGVEFDAAAAARASERIDIVVEGSVLDVELPFDEGAFDLIVFADVLEHLADPDAALRRCLPLLAGGGRIIVSVPNMRFWLMLLRLAADRWEYAEHGIRDRTHLRIFTKRTLLATLSDHGLVVETLTRNQRLFDDQSQIGRAGALATRAVVTTLGRWPCRDLLAYQYVAIARRAAP